MKKIIFTLSFFLIVGQFNSLMAQDEKVRDEIETEKEIEGATLLFGADIFSRYIWRGYDFGNSPAIQPNICFAWKGFNIGAWGSYAFAKHSIQVNDSTIEDAGNFSEIDLYLSYTYKWFTLLFFDYFPVNGLNANYGNKYFDYRNRTTGHTFEGCLSFDGTESFPLKVMVSTLFWGEDKNRDSTGTYGLGSKNNFSTYIELGVTIKIKKIDVVLKPFIGGIPFGSAWYGPYAGITNLGLTAKKSIPITPLYALPIQASLVANPQGQNVYLVFGISL
ncbi:MAG: hypothetical protein WCK84_02710 [Bacteroidota bacterium]